MEDYISYGQIDDIVIQNSGSNYDIVNPPNIVISNTNGSGAKLHGHFSGDISDIVVTHQGLAGVAKNAAPENSVLIQYVMFMNDPSLNKLIKDLSEGNTITSS